MFNVTSESLELRGLENKKSTKGNVYYVLHCETVSGKALAFYMPANATFPENLKKGDKIVITFEVTYYKGNERLVVSTVSKA